jgi:hypothetical protein
MESSKWKKVKDGSWGSSSAALTGGKPGPLQGLLGCWDALDILWGLGGFHPHVVTE